MEATVQPSNIKGNIVAPASKSAMQRACAASLIRGGRVKLYNPGSSADDQAAINIISQLGANVERSGKELVIESKGIQPESALLDCGESGLSVRMFTSIAATSKKEINITGSGSLLKRPLSFFNEVLPQLNVQCESNEGYLPMMIKGPMKPRNIEVDGSLSSQFLTGLLFAYSAADASDVTIRVNQLNSKPYIDLTLRLMADFGLKTPENRDYKEFYFSPLVHSVEAGNEMDFTVEGDWSGGAFLLVAGAIAGHINIKGLDLFSTQADRAVLQALMQSGAIMSVQEKQIELHPGPLQAFHFNATDCPDLFPPLVALAAYCKGKSVIEGVNRLTHKESNRGLTLKEEFGKMGVQITLQDNLMIIEGGGEVTGTQVSSRHDHRIAMACAVAALKANGAMIIEGAEAVNKSYPMFWEDLKQLNADITLINT